MDCERASGTAVATRAGPPLALPAVRPAVAGGRSGSLSPGCELVERGPQAVGCGRPGPRETVLVGQLGPVVGAADPVPFE